MKTILILLALSINASAWAATQAPPTATILKGKINRALKGGQSLKGFYTSVSQEYGGGAIRPLLEIASDDSNTDETRWAALFGLARIAGRQSLGVIRKFMVNSSWMLRDAALKTAAALDARELTPQIELRLKDDALIVRTTAVETIGQLNLKTSAPKLVDALFDPVNFHAGKALWIHKHILQVLKDFHYNTAVPKLVELLEKSDQDSQLQDQLLATIENLTGRSFPGKSMQQQIYLWKRNTLSDATF